MSAHDSLSFSKVYAEASPPSQFGAGILDPTLQGLPRDPGSSVGEYGKGELTVGPRVSVRTR